MTLMQVFLAVGDGALLTLQLLMVSLVFGFVLGTGFLILRYQGVWMQRLVQGITSLLRGVPMVVQIGWVYFAFPFQLSLFWTGVLAFGINSAAYVAEILRSGLRAVPEGQWEAAKVLGIVRWSLWRRVLMPQVIRNSFPSLVNEVTSLLKETSLISTIGGLDIMRRAQMVAAADYSYFWPLFVAAVYYYVMVRVFEYVGEFLMKRFS